MLRRARGEREGWGIQEEPFPDNMEGSFRLAARQRGSPLVVLLVVLANLLDSARSEIKAQR